MNEPKFLRPFEAIWADLRRFQVRMGLCATLCIAAFGLVLLAAADYRFELPRAVRAVGLAVAALLSVVVFWRSTRGPATANRASVYRAK